MAVPTLREPPFLLKIRGHQGKKGRCKYRCEGPEQNLMFKFCLQIAQRHTQKNGGNLSHPPKIKRIIWRLLTNENKGVKVITVSSVKCHEQDITSPHHRFQKAVGCARRQQGAGRLSPASSRDESSGQAPLPRSSGRFPPLMGHAVRHSAVRAAGERSGTAPGKQSGNAEV